MIFHITTQKEWETAKANGIYVVPSLENEGFIHCSKKEQILDTANNYFRGPNQTYFKKVFNSRIGKTGMRVDDDFWNLETCP